MMTSVTQETSQLSRKYHVGDIVYKVTPKDDGGVVIDRHEVKQIGWSEREGIFMENGEEVKKKYLVAHINSIEMGDDNKFIDENYFVDASDLPQEVLKNINRKKLW